MWIKAAVLVCLAGSLPGAAGDGMLVAPEWLAAHIGDPSLVVLHVGSARDYEAGHLPGARLLTLADISITGERGLRLELPPLATLREAFARLGVANDSRIVLYAATESVQSATRAWFTLDYLGMGDRAALLDGGLRLWRAQGRRITTEAPHSQTGEFTPRPRPELVVDAAWVRAHLQDPAVALLDARAPQFYSGADAGGMPRAGHIPGARSVPYTSVLDPEGRLKPASELRATLASAGRTVVSYCHIGQQATVLYFVARYLGQEARLYDGSFQDWSARSDLPVKGIQ